MTEADEKHESLEEQKPGKQGLHGWKAALAMFGCGSLAAFGFFGVLALLVTSFLDLTSSGVQGEGEGDAPVPEAVGEPQASIDPGDLDVCGRNLETAGSLTLTRVDSGGNFEDPGEGEERIVQDQCEWELSPDVSADSSWGLEYDYQAFISDSGGEREEVASREFEERSESLAAEFDEVSSEGEENLADGAYFVFGEVESGVHGYYLVAQTRSAVYEMKLTAVGGDEVTQQSMKNEADKIVDVSDIEFNIWIPE
ncbi:hypothetical protein [Nocardiopsis salina]|uniref:hypothetical protein n=1 Tax=Nocardiopsis salina TaxID=245836 RepID=UPI001268D5AD|nr:hypothetical protein [Nocardiopsis salina]